MSSAFLLRARHRLPLALLVLSLSAGGLLVGCSTQKRQPDKVPEPAETPEIKTEPAAGSKPVLPPASMSRVIDFLNAGQEELAHADLLRILQLEPNHKLANQLLRHLQIDPVQLLGRESYAYTVKPNETLSRIAQRVLGDAYAFYLLARYNDIKIPRQVTGGQVIRLPGKAPAPQPQPPAPPPPAPPVVSAPPPAPPPEPPPAERKARIDAAVRRGYEKLNRQDLKGSLEQWDLVLNLEPAHVVARRERARVLKLWGSLCSRDPANKPANCP